MSAHRKEDWMNTKWRPAMGWSYMLTCIADFVVFPILWSLLQALDKGSVTIQWQPITLQGAGLYHIAMGAVLGVAAYGRTQEKLGGANNGFNTPTSGPATPGFPPASGFSSPGPSVNTGFGAPSGFNSNPGFGAAAAAPFGAAAVGAAGGFAAATMMPAMAKPMPSRPPFEENFPELD
jgi:hypothetical protein